MTNFSLKYFRHKNSLIFSGFFSNFFLNFLSGFFDFILSNKCCMLQKSGFLTNFNEFFFNFSGTSFRWRTRRTVPPTASKWWKSWPRFLFAAVDGTSSIIRTRKKRPPRNLRHQRPPRPQSRKPRFNPLILTRKDNPWSLRKFPKVRRTAMRQIRQYSLHCSLNSLRISQVRKINKTTVCLHFSQKVSCLYTRYCLYFS